MADSSNSSYFKAPGSKLPDPRASSDADTSSAAATVPAAFAAKEPGSRSLGPLALHEDIINRAGDSKSAAETVYGYSSGTAPCSGRPHGNTHGLPLAITTFKDASPDTAADAALHPLFLEKREEANRDPFNDTTGRSERCTSPAAAGGGLEVVLPEIWHEHIMLQLGPQDRAAMLATCKATLALRAWLPMALRSRACLPQPPARWLAFAAGLHRLTTVKLRASRGDDLPAWLAAAAAAPSSSAALALATVTRLRIDCPYTELSEDHLRSLARLFPGLRRLCVCAADLPLGLGPALASGSPSLERLKLCWGMRALTTPDGCWRPAGRFVETLRNLAAAMTSSLRDLRLATHDAYERPSSYEHAFGLMGALSALQGLRSLEWGLPWEAEGLLELSPALERVTRLTLGEEIFMDFGQEPISREWVDMVSGAARRMGCLRELSMPRTTMDSYLWAHGLAHMACLQTLQVHGLGDVLPADVQWQAAHLPPLRALRALLCSYIGVEEVPCANRMLRAAPLLAAPVAVTAATAATASGVCDLPVDAINSEVVGVAAATLHSQLFEFSEVCASRGIDVSLALQDPPRRLHNMLVGSTQPAAAAAAAAAAAPGAAPQLRAITCVTLHYVEVNAVVLRALVRALPRLRALVLEGCRLQAAPLSLLAGAKELRTVALHGCSCVSAAALRVLVVCKRVYMAGCGGHSLGLGRGAAGAGGGGGGGGGNGSERCGRLCIEVQGKVSGCEFQQLHALADDCRNSQAVQLSLDLPPP